MCFVVCVDMVKVLRNFGPYGIIFMACGLFVCAPPVGLPARVTFVVSTEP